MFCKNCLKEIPNNSPFCIHCGKEQQIENTTSENISDKNKYTDTIKSVTKNTIYNIGNSIKKAPTKIKLISIFVAVCLIAVILLLNIFNRNSIVGKWENGQLGYIIFTKDNQFFVDNDNITGKYKTDGSTLIIYKENGNIEYWKFSISDDILTMTYEDETMALYKTK